MSQIERFTKMCGASIPASLRDLLAGGAAGLHFYTLNRNHSAQEILGLLRAEGRV